LRKRDRNCRREVWRGWGRVSRSGGGSAAGRNGRGRGRGVLWNRVERTRGLHSCIIVITPLFFFFLVVKGRYERFGSLTGRRKGGDWKRVGFTKRGGPWRYIFDIFDLFNVAIGEF
jgi:hypothetical protein